MPKLEYIKQNLLMVFAVLTVGFPFVGYKILFGIIVSHLYDGHWVANIVACGFIVWGLIDFVLNAICLHAASCRGSGDYPTCLLSLITRKHPPFAKWRDAGEALDVMLSFTIVALVVGKSMFGYLDGSQVKLWNICTAVNLLGAGIARLGTSWAALR